MSTALPTYFLSHGGGPWPFMKEQYGATYDVLQAALADLPNQLGGPPEAVLVVSSHWEEREPTFSSGAQPGMIRDYNGFPAHTYQVQYNAPGSPAVAERACAVPALRQHSTRRAASTAAPFRCSTRRFPTPACRSCSSRSSTASIRSRMWRWGARWRRCEAKAS